MKYRTGVLATVLLLGVAAMVYAESGATIQIGSTDNPLTIRRLLRKFDQAQATAPFRYPTACVAGTAEEYTQMALRAGLQGAGDVQLDLWTVPEEFAPVEHPDPDRKSGRCDYRVSGGGGSQSTHFIADFFSRKRPRTGEIAYVKVWQEGGREAVLVGFPNGARGLDPHITFKAIPVDARP